MKIRPCIDLRAGRVVQIVGSTLSDADPGRAITNFESDRPAAEFARRYRDDQLAGGHVIALGAGSEHAALTALAAWPGGMQYGGGVDAGNAHRYLDAGASHVIVTSFVFREGRLDLDRLRALVGAVGRERLVLDLSCRWRQDAFYVVTDRWQRFTNLRVTADLLARLGNSCDEFLVHGVDAEGKRQGVIEPLVELLGSASTQPVTYAGGIRHLYDIELVDRLGSGHVDVTVGSALDLFGGDLAYEDVVAWQRQRDSI
jgi:phosphoribosylformimino-5-aminoimidazole carboxamide ribotide isomerase